MALLLIAFIAGLLTVLAPCTLPLLPVIIGGSVSGQSNVRRALVIAGSLAASVFAFTLLLKATTLFINVPQEFWQILSGGLLIIFGIVTLFPSLWEHFAFANTLNLSSNRLLAQGYTRQNLLGDIIMGAALGPVFSSCSPTYFIVLATVLPVHPAEGVLYLFAYCIGLVLSLLAVSVLGQRIVLALGIASDPRGWFKQIIGILFVLIGLVIASGYSTQLEANILSHAGIFDVTRVEQALLQGPSTDSTDSPQAGSRQATSTPTGALSPEQKALIYKKAPELAGIDGYINTGGQPITLASLRGKVVLIDFWTYSCINCLRTLPYTEAWYQKYKDEGLVIIGVHTPEFAFEHVQANVAKAVSDLGIKYPVVQDNEYKTWNAFGNNFWPNEYLIDIDGYIVDNHAGEGDYDKTEAAIQAALRERAVRLGTTAQLPGGTVSVAPADLTGIQSPETYFGSNRNEFLGNGTRGVSGVQTFTLPTSPSPNTLYLGGTWDINSEYAQPQSGGEVEYFYSAHDIYLVASAASPVTVKVLRDGQPVSTFAGADVDPKTSTATIQANRLYRLVHDPAAGAHTITITVQGEGLQAYTFTFG